jgi:hypothetical protein
MLKLSHSMSVMIPGKKKSGESIVEQSNIARKIASQLAVRNGGATIRPSLGFWINESNQVVEEPILEVVSYTEDIGENDRQFLLAIADQIKLDLEQEAVSVTFDNVLELV